MKPTPHITDLEPLKDYRLLVHFDNGEQRIFDAQPYTEMSRFYSELSDEDYFRQVKVLPYGRGVQWPNEQDFSRDTLYGKGLRVVSVKEGAFAQAVQKALQALRLLTADLSKVRQSEQRQTERAGSVVG